MSKIKMFAAAVLVSIPMLSLNAASVEITRDVPQVQMPQDVAQVQEVQDAAPLQLPQGAAPVLSDGKPTTADGGCFWIIVFGFWFLVC